MAYATNLSGTSYRFPTLRSLLAKASPARSGDVLAGTCARSNAERIAAQIALADVPLRRFLEEAVIPYETDEVTRLIQDTHDTTAFAPISSLTVGEFREWLLADSTDAVQLARIARGVTPEMAAAVSKIMRNQDLILAARKCEVVTRFRSTVGLPGRLSVRLQPNHPTDDPAGIMASTLDGLMYGAGDAMIGINPASDDPKRLATLWFMLDDLISRYAIPTQSCVLTHVTRQIEAIERHVPIDLIFQSVGGTERVNSSFGISLSLLREAHEAGMSVGRCGPDGTAMYFETGQGSALSAAANHEVDQQTIEARAHGVARHFRPFLVNSVVGFIGPEYLQNGKQITRAGLEDHFCGKVLGLPMGVDICYTNHSDADQDDADDLLLLLGAAGVNFVMGVPGADDVLLGYQSTSYHDALFVRRALGLRRAPEFERWLEFSGMTDPDGRLLPGHAATALGELTASLSP